MPRPYKKTCHSSAIRERLALAAILTLATPALAQLNRLPPPTLPNETQSADIASPGATKSNIVYGIAGKTKLTLDVFAPKPPSPTPVPAIVLIHGGSWLEGDKSMLANMAHYLASKGYVAFSINYRLHDGKKNRWPAQLDDAQRAVRWVRAHAAEYHVDPNRIGAWGHSAGAQMAALLGELDTRDNSDPALTQYSSRVQAVVDVAGPVDFTAFHDPDGDAFLADLLGATEKQNPQLWKSASPIYNIGKNTAPFLIVHGTRDNAVPIAESVSFANALNHAGIPVTLIQLDDGHTFETEAAKRRLAYESVQFFDKYLAASATPAK